MSDIDTNFPFPVRELSNTRIKLTPFIPSVHATAFFDKCAPHQATLWAHVPLGPFRDADDFANMVRDGVQPDNGTSLYAIIDLIHPVTKDENAGLAGIASFGSTSVGNLFTDVGVITLPQYQRTHVTTNTVGLLLQHAFDTKDGMGLRRVEWRTSSVNFASQVSAERMGFTKDGVLRWATVFPGGKAKQKQGNGRKIPLGADEKDIWRDTVVYSICWDDWETGTKDAVIKLMERGL